MQVYYHNGKQHQKLDEVYYHPGFRNFIDLHIPQNALVISFPDVTPNGTLSIIQRHGSSQYGFRQEKMNKEDLELMIQRGCKYYLCNHNYNISDSCLKSHLNSLVAQFETLSVYSLK